MSLEVPRCKKCNALAECEMVSWFAEGNPSLFAVCWSCPRCGPVTVVVSPLGPADVEPDTCVHCGASGATDSAPCSACGFSIREILSPADMKKSDAELLEMVRETFLRGTCRIGLSIANFVLRRNPQCDDAREAKRAFIEHLDANGALAPAR